MTGFVENPVSQLEKLSSIGRDLLIGQETIAIRPLKFGQLIKAIKIMAPIIRLAEGVDQEMGLERILAEAPEALVEVAILCTGKPRPWFEALESDQGVDVLGAVLEVNKDFFDQRLGEKLRGLREKFLPQKLATTGTPR